MSPRRTNRSELDDLSPMQRTAVQDGARSLDGLTGRASFEAWLVVAKGIVPLCALADKPGRSRNARRSLFKEAGYGSLSAANVSRLLHMGRLADKIHIWRMGLKPNERDRWNSPATICEKCPEVRKAIEEANKNRPPRQPRPRPAVNPSDELERAINRVYDLVNAIEDVDLRRQQIERLTTLLAELLESDKPQPTPPTPAAPKTSGRKKTPKQKTETTSTGSLAWKDSGGRPGERKWTAPARVGIYMISSPANAFTGAVSHYAVEHIPDPSKPLLNDNRRFIAHARTLPKAKDEAEADHAKAGKN